MSGREEIHIGPPGIKWRPLFKTLGEYNEFWERFYNTSDEAGRTLNDKLRDCNIRRAESEEASRNHIVY